MDFLDSVPACGAEMQRFMMMNAMSLPADIREELLKAAGAPSQVDSIVNTGELFYAVRDQLSSPALTLGAQLIAFATQNGWHGLTVDNRGSRIVSAFRRDLGEEHPFGEWPDPSTDPEPLPFYAGLNAPTPLPTEA